MAAPLGTLRSLRSALANKLTTPAKLAETALANANQNPSHNTYLWRDPAWTLAEAGRAEAMPARAGGAFGDGRPTLWGLPVSVKDCFDLAGSPTTFGTRFYEEKNGIATRDSWIVERLRARGAVITGKTHLHPLAYGITGQNPDYGDCLQPRRQGALTGGSSSGACASVMEGSAVAAIGTDTGGSIRVPAALCGLAGYRASLGRGDWRGGAHLAQSFDTLGWLFADLEEAPLLGDFLAEKEPERIPVFGRFGTIGPEFLHDCEPEVLACYRETIAQMESLGLRSAEVEVRWWDQAMDIFAPIQASEAAALHRGNFDAIQPAIRERLEWGARISSDELINLRAQHAEFRARMDMHFEEFQVILLPAAPVARLDQSADHTNTRKRILRYTAPFSLAGVPAVTIPCTAGGMQMAAARGQDEGLLRLAALIGARRRGPSVV